MLSHGLFGTKVDYYKDQLFVQGLALILNKDRHRRNSNASETRPKDTEDEKPSWIQGLLGRGDATAPPNDLESGLAGESQPTQQMQRNLVMDMKMTGLSAVRFGRYPLQMAVAHSFA